jgi:hypothetical protein
MAVITRLNEHVAVVSTGYTFFMTPRLYVQRQLARVQRILKDRLTANTRTECTNVGSFACFGVWRDGDCAVE